VNRRPASLVIAGLCLNRHRGDATSSRLHRINRILVDDPVEGRSPFWGSRPARRGGCRCRVATVRTARPYRRRCPKTRIAGAGERRWGGRSPADQV